MVWLQSEIDFLIQHYPSKGKLWCAQELGKSESSIRLKTYRLGLKQDKNSEFFKEWQEKAKKSKVGKKRPEQSLVMKKLHQDGKLKKTKEQRERMSVRTKEWIAKNGHPRGALGIKHSATTREKISLKSKQMWANMPEDMRNSFAKRASENGRKASFNRTNASWKAGWREIGGVNKYYRSRWEANYARYLEWLKQNKQITKWEHEPETFWFDGIKRGVMSYLPDFRVTENDGSIVFHEVKGWMDDRSKTKIKRMAKYHPEVKLIVIDSKIYKSIEKKAKFLIREWE